MKKTFRTILLLSAFAIAIGCSTNDSYPKQPITIVVPNAQGGANDIMARLMIASGENKIKNQPIIIVNKPGGNEVVGFSYVAKSKPDGYTLIMGWGGSTSTFARQVSDLPYDPFKDFTPVIGTASFSQCLAVSADSPFKTLDELVKYAKEHPGELRWTHSAVNGLHYLLGLDFFKKADIKLTEVVNTEGGAAARNLVASKSVDVGIFATFLAKGFENKIRLLAICDDQRDPIMKNIPLFSELGYEVANVSECKMIAAPAGTPKEIIDILYKSFKAMLESESCKKAFGDLGYTIRAWNPEQCLEAAKKLDSMYAQIIEDFNIKPPSK